MTRISSLKSGKREKNREAVEVFNHFLKNYKECIEKIKKRHEPLTFEEIKSKIYTDGSFLKFLSEKEQLQNEDLCHTAYRLNKKNLKYIKNFDLSQKIRHQYEGIIL